MGGVSVSVDNCMKQQTVKVKEGIDDDEYIIVRIERFAFPINVISYYGEQEGRTTQDKVVSRWGRLEKDLENLRSKGEEVILIGDFNKLIGSDDLGIKGHNIKISAGGKLVRELLASENSTLVNNTEKAQGGPYTREDPSDGRRKSCLDFALVTNKLLPFIKELLIDSERKYAMNRVTYEKGVLTLKPSDHYTMFLVFHNLPLGIEKKEKDVRWNLNKPGGWKKYEEVTDRAKDSGEQV